MRAAPRPSKKSSSWFGSKTKKKSGKKPGGAAPEHAAASGVVVPPNLGSATSFGISVDGVSMVVNVPKGVDGEPNPSTSDVPLRRARARVATAPARARRARTGAGARGRLVRLVGAGAGARAQAGLVRLAHGARPAGGRGRAAAVGAQETRRDVERRAERHDGRGALLSAGSSLPLVGRLCEAAQSCWLGRGILGEGRRRPGRGEARRRRAQRRPDDGPERGQSRRRAASWWSRRCGSSWTCSSSSTPPCASSAKKVGSSARSRCRATSRRSGGWTSASSRSCRSSGTWLRLSVPVP